MTTSRLCPDKAAKRAALAASVLLLTSLNACATQGLPGLAEVQPTPWQAATLAAAETLEASSPTGAARMLDPATPTAAQTRPTLSEPGQTPSPARTPSANDPVTHCQPGWCAYPGHLSLARPIADARWDTVDPTYRYGSTQNGTRELHTGVEFPAPESTPVLAAASGEVVVAGGDTAAHQVAGNEGYGNVVILEHKLAEGGDILYTLYAHLSEIDVKPGQAVQAGSVIARVGDTGAATGPHLHFEVRLGGQTIEYTRNPELWLAPHQNQGEFNGALVARVQDADGTVLPGVDVVLQATGSAPIGQGGVLGNAIYQQTYADAHLYPDDQYQENYGVGDLAPGWYRISYLSDGTMIEQNAQVFPGQVTVVTFK